MLTNNYENKSARGWCILEIRNLVKCRGEEGAIL